MTVKAYTPADLPRLVEFLRERHRESGNLTCWLPQRLEDLVYRIDTLYAVERGKLKSQDFIRIWEENGEVAALLIPDGDSANTCIRKGYEYLFPEMLDVAERELLPLFTPGADGSIDFLVIAHDSLTHEGEELTRRGYVRDEEGDCDNLQRPQEKDYDLTPPAGFRQVYGEGLDETEKVRTVHLGFHPADEGTGHLEGMASYQARKGSSFYPDSFESFIVTDGGDCCAGCFCYVDRVGGTAFLEPVSTREQYRRKGLGTLMLHGAMVRLKEMGIRECWVNSYGWRRAFYNAAGFETVDTIGFWHKKLRV